MPVVFASDGTPLFVNDANAGGALRCATDGGGDCCCCECTIPTRRSVGPNPVPGQENDCIACTETDVGTPSTIQGMRFTVSGTGVSRPMNWSDFSSSVITTPSCTPTIPPIAGTYVFSRDLGWSCIGGTAFLPSYTFDSSGCPATGGTAESAIYRCRIGASFQAGIGFIAEISTRLLFLNGSGAVVGGAGPSLSGWVRTAALPITNRQQWRWEPTPPCYERCNQILTVFKCTQTLNTTLAQAGTMTATHNSWLMTGVEITDVEIF